MRNGQTNKGGRPRVAEPLSTVSTRLPPAYHDRLVQMAGKHDVSISRLVRTLLTLQIKKTT
jgi:predicted HicB family RNase H-like nuclease